MSSIHFLNVNEGDCTWIQHSSGHNTLIDICNGNAEIRTIEELLQEACTCESAVGNYRQKKHPDNPISYLENNGVNEIFRFILTHPDMDHMDGIRKLFETFKIHNFWDTDNHKEMNDSDWNKRKYNKDDWEYYKDKLRSNSCGITRLNLYAGSIGTYYNRGDNSQSNGDGLYILAPTKELVAQANKSKKYNNCSYVILYKINERRIIFAGDSEEKTWNYIIENFESEIKNIDVLIAPHHGRESGGNDEYLNVLQPKLTLIGNAKSEYLDYNAFNNRNLVHITNNQAGSIILNTERKEIQMFVANREYAKKLNPNKTWHNERLDAWWVMEI